MKSCIEDIIRWSYPPDMDVHIETMKEDEEKDMETDKAGRAGVYDIIKKQGSGNENSRTKIKTHGILQGNEPRRKYHETGCV